MKPNCVNQPADCQCEYCLLNKVEQLQKEISNLKELHSNQRDSIKSLQAREQHLLVNLGLSMDEAKDLKAQVARMSSIQTHWHTQYMAYKAALDNIISYCTDVQECGKWTIETAPASKGH